jgi:hypothetical protein
MEEVTRPSLERGQGTFAELLKLDILVSVMKMRVTHRRSMKTRE